MIPASRPGAEQDLFESAPEDQDELLAPVDTLGGTEPPHGHRALRCTVVTPERAYLDVKTADFVVLPMYDGELGVLPGRAALVGRLGSGELRIYQGTAIRRLFVDGGFAQVRSNVVTVLTAGVIPVEELTQAGAEQALQDALAMPENTLGERAARAKAQQRAVGMLRVVEKNRPTH